jgi:hypothetical protein
MGSSLRSRQGSQPAEFPQQWMRGGDSPKNEASPLPKGNKTGAALTPDHKPSYKLFGTGSVTGDFEGACCEYHMIQMRLERMAALKAAEGARKSSFDKPETIIPVPDRRPPMLNY